MHRSILPRSAVCECVCLCVCLCVWYVCVCVWVCSTVRNYLLCNIPPASICNVRFTGRFNTTVVRALVRMLATANAMWASATTTQPRNNVVAIQPQRHTQTNATRYKTTPTPTSPTCLHIPSAYLNNRICNISLLVEITPYQMGCDLVRVCALVLCILLLGRLQWSNEWRGSQFWCQNGLNTTNRYINYHLIIRMLKSHCNNSSKKIYDLIKWDCCTYTKHPAVNADDWISAMTIPFPVFRKRFPKIIVAFPHSLHAHAQTTESFPIATSSTKYIPVYFFIRLRKVSFILLRLQLHVGVQLVWIALYCNCSLSRMIWKWLHPMDERNWKIIAESIIHGYRRERSVWP